MSPVTVNIAEEYVKLFEGWTDLRVDRGFGQVVERSQRQSNVSVSDSWIYGDASLTLEASGDLLSGMASTGEVNNGGITLYGSTTSWLYLGIGGVVPYGSTVLVTATWRLTGTLKASASLSYPYSDNVTCYADAQAPLSFGGGIHYSIYDQDFGFEDTARVHISGGEADGQGSSTEEKPIAFTKTMETEITKFSEDYITIGTVAQTSTSAGASVGGTASARATWSGSVTVTVSLPQFPQLSLELTIVSPSTDKLTADNTSKIKLLATIKEGRSPLVHRLLLFNTSVSPSDTSIWPHPNQLLESATGDSEYDAGDGLRVTTNENGEAKVTFTAPYKFTSTPPFSGYRVFGYRNPKLEPPFWYSSTPRQGFIRSVSFNVIVTDPESGETATKTITIFQTPVLLIHGIRSSFSDAWEKPEMNMYRVLLDGGFMVFPMDYDWKKSIGSTASVNLPSELRRIKGDMVRLGITSSKIDIVAHSMGGLVSRFYTTIPPPYYKDDVRKIVMIGTPNDGSPMANSTSAQLYLYNAISLDEMIPDSVFLKNLNSPKPHLGGLWYNPNVEHFAIVGTKNTVYPSRSLFGDIDVTSWYVDEGDGIVSKSSQNHNNQFRFKTIYANHQDETSSVEAANIIIGVLIDENTLLYNAESPVNILVTDPQGRRVGYDSTSGSVVNEVPDAFYTGPAASIEQSQGVMIANPLTGHYIVVAFGIAAGNFTISITSMDANGTVLDQNKFSGSVSPGERVKYVFTSDTKPPVANAGQDQKVTTGATVTFDASNSSDNVDIVSYEWDFGDGAKGTGKIIDYKYINPGTYKVTLIVKDAVGNSAADIITITVLSPEGSFLWYVTFAAIIIVLVFTTLLVMKRRKRHHNS